MQRLPKSFHHLRPSKLHFSLLVFLVCLLFTFLLWDHYFNSDQYYDKIIVSNLVLAMGTLLSASFGMFAWSLESRQNYLHTEVRRRTEEALANAREAAASEARANEAEKRQEELERAYKKLEEAQEKLVQSEKLASAGRVVAGLVHELNNPLVTMQGFLRLILDEPLSEQLRNRLNIVARQAVICHATVRDLLTFSRRRAVIYEKIAVPELFDEILEYLSPELSLHHIEIVRKFPPAQVVIEGDREQLRRVFTNLLVNAVHALEAVKSGAKREICVSIIPAGAALQVFVRDSGTGISRESLSKIFEPFFTTKPAGKGTGLGLSLCYGIVLEHGGSISAQSQEGSGTTFLVELPVKRPNVRSSSTAEQRSDGAAVTPGRNVLVVDDEPQVLEFVTHLLSGWGYKIHTAQSGPAALEILRRHQAEIDLVILDINMPKMNGFEMFDTLRQQPAAENLPVIFLTGLHDEESIARTLRSRRTACLEKPFQYEELHSAVETLLKAA